MAATLPDTTNHKTKLFVACALLITLLDVLQIVFLGKGLPAFVGAAYYLLAAFFHRHPGACVATIILPLLPTTVLLFGLSPSTSDTGMKTVYLIQVALATVAGLRLWDAKNQQ